MKKERHARWYEAGLCSLLVTSSGCGEARDAAAPSPDEEQSPAGVESAPVPSAPTSPSASSRECTGTSIVSSAPLLGFEVRAQADLDVLEGCEVIRGSLRILPHSPASPHHSTG